MHPSESELGKKSSYDSSRNPDRLVALPRLEKRLELAIEVTHLPFQGVDIWNHYEVSWLNSKGKPIVATATIRYDCKSEFIVESKSLKLYFNSLNNTHFSNVSELENCLQADLEKCLSTAVTIKVTPLQENSTLATLSHFKGTCLDDLDIECSVYTVDSTLLKTENETVTETLYTNLLRSNCLVTQQPDWGSVQIDYSGPKIDHASLLKYLVSYRNHNEFHEQCIERIFMDISRQCRPDTLTVYGRFTRRGGIDINPLRTNAIPLDSETNFRLYRQ